MDYLKLRKFTKPEIYDISLAPSFIFRRGHSAMLISKSNGFQNGALVNDELRHIFAASRGSEWRIWDLHVHTPASHGYNGTYDDFVSNAQQSKASVIGIKRLLHA
jgi:hypothetical protein